MRLKPDKIKNKATIASALALDKTKCQGAIASRKALINPNLLFLKIATTRKNTAKTVILPNKAPGNLVANSVSPKSIMGITVK